MGETIKIFCIILNAYAHTKPNVFYTAQIDQHGRLTNPFWRDSLRKFDEDYFGDVMFDTTYPTSKCSMICTSFFLGLITIGRISCSGMHFYWLRSQLHLIGYLKCFWSLWVIRLHKPYWLINIKLWQKPFKWRFQKNKTIQALGTWGTMLIKTFYILTTC